MIKIALIGGPGCGKSTQCAHYFSILKEKSINVAQVQEWIREALSKGIIFNSPWCQFWIYEEQKAKETSISDETEYLITDSPTILSYIYALRNAVLPSDGWLLCKMYEKFINDVSKYDYIFYVEREKEYISDGVRFQSEDEAISIDNDIKLLLDTHSIKYYKIYGDLNTRSNMMNDIIFNNTGDIG